MLVTDTLSAARDRSGFQWVLHHANHQPDAVAIAGGDAYRALAANVSRLVDALTHEGVSRGQVLGVETADRYLHLLILLAAEALSVTTMSLSPSELEPPASLGRLCDRILVSRPNTSDDPAKTVVMTLDWIAAALARPAALERLDTPEPSPGFVVRLIKSSGTTGVPKVMATTHAVLSGIVHSNLLDFPPRIARRVNFLCLYNFTVRAVHWRAWLALRTGGTICFTGGDVLLPAIRSGVGNFVSFMPGDLARFVQSIPGDSDTGGRRPFDLRIDVSGGAVSNEVRRAARRMLTNDLNIIYAANEIQRISRVDDDEVGTLFPEVSVEIVDDRGNALPLGHYGTIRARSDLMVKAYIDAPELTRAAFIDGWYHSNDIGFQPSAGKLIVLGRADDMLNAGGVKIAPRPIEERLMTITGVRDALVTTIGEGETSVLLAAAETGGDGDVMEQRAAMERIASGYATDFRILVVAEFPRTETGKVLREDVRRLWRQSAIAGMI